MLIFMPAWNEEETVAAVVRAVQNQLLGVDVLVVDDGSTDRTVEVARRAGALVAPLPFHQGLGAALHTGYMLAERGGYDICAHLDADGQHSAGDLERLLVCVASGSCDVALGSRFFAASAEELVEHEGYRPTISRRLGVELFSRLLSFTTRHRFTDIASGFRAANRRTICLFAATYAPDFHELDSLQRAVRQGLRIQEVPVRMLPRAGGRSKITPLRSAFFVFKGLMILAVGSFRHAEVEYVRPDHATSTPTGS